MAREEQRELPVAAALRVAVERGPAESTVRRTAEAAGTSTMAVYSGFGGRAGVLEALLRRAFDLLGQALRTVPTRDSATGYLWKGPTPHARGALAVRGWSAP